MWLTHNRARRWNGRWNPAWDVGQGAGSGIGSDHKSEFESESKAVAGSESECLTPNGKAYANPNQKFDANALGGPI